MHKLHSESKGSPVPDVLKSTVRHTLDTIEFISEHEETGDRLKVYENILRDSIHEPDLVTAYASLIEIAMMSDMKLSLKITKYCNDYLDVSESMSCYRDFLKGCTS